MRNAIHIYRPEEPHERFSLGPYIIDTLLPREMTAHSSAYLVSIAPRKKTRTSYHHVAEEIYYVLSGSGTAILNGETRAIEAGDLIRLPPGTRHAFETRDDELRILDIHVPPVFPDHDTFWED